ncbi:MAG TPA: hypothetical protein VGK77_02265 [Candidatus Binatia bacterium]|jgi:hypothetical protein
MSKAIKRFGRRYSIGFALSACLVFGVGSALLATTSFAGGPPTVAVQVTGQTSTPGGIPPTHVGINWDYDYNAPASGIVDSIPVQICATSNNAGDTSNDGYPLELKFVPTGPGGNLPGVTFPTDPVFLTDGCTTVNVSINSGPLSNPIYTKNFHVEAVSASPANTHVNLSDPKLPHQS